MKVCSKCKKSKPLDSFGKCKATKDGYQYTCRLCVKGYDKRDRMLRYWQTKRLRAKVDFSITCEYLREIWTDTCPALGIPISLGLHQSEDGLAHLDRIDSNKGYIKGNVQWLSGKANRIKTNATNEELKLLLTFMENQDGKR